MTITIIQARPEHVPTVRELLLACTKELRRRGIEQWDEIYPDLDAVQDEVAAGNVYVALEGPSCVASMTLDASPDAAYDDVAWLGSGPALIMHRLCVDPAHQGRGIGRMMLAFAEELATSRGYASLRLDVYSGNQIAVRVYERSGFTTTGKVYFPRRDRPFYCMEKLLSPS